MAKIIRGPFNVKFGANTLAEISTLKVAYTVDTTDTATVQGHKKRVFGAHMVTVTATFLQSDVPSLAVALPQYFVANGGVLSTGETVTDPNGAMDIVPGGCAAAANPLDLIITACGSNAEVFRVLGAVSEIAGVSIDEKTRMVDVEFTGQNDGATIQMFNSDAISVIS